MFFAKTENKQTTAPRNICILGTSALGFYLASELQKNGHKITILCLPQEADEFGATDFIIKNEQCLQSHRHNFHYSFELDFAPDLLLIASNITCLRRDLLLLSPRYLAETPIVSFTPTTPNSLISDILKKVSINAYFNGWLSRDKNHVTNFSRPSNIIFSLEELSPQATALRDIFSGIGIETSAKNQDAANFWHWFAPRIIATLLDLPSGKSIHALGKTKEGRAIIDSCVNEVANLAMVDNVKIERSEILTQIYAIPENYTPLLQKLPRTASALLLERLSALLFHGISPEDDRFRLLQRLIKKIRNKL